MSCHPVNFRAHPSACIDLPCDIGAGTRIWHFVHVMSGAQIGQRCSLGQGVFIAAGVRIGHDVKIQNQVSVYAGVDIDDACFIGPACVFTNVKNPRSEIDRRALYERTCVRRGATLGANATILCPRTLGRYSFVAAGSVVTADVPDYALVAGVPARQMGWMSRHGQRLLGADAHGIWHCAQSGWRYRLEAGQMHCLDADADAPLPMAAS